MPCLKNGDGEVWNIPTTKRRNADDWAVLCRQVESTCNFGHTNISAFENFRCSPAAEDDWKQDGHHRQHNVRTELRSSTGQKLYFLSSEKQHSKQKRKHTEKQNCHSKRVRDCNPESIFFVCFFNALVCELRVSSSVACFPQLPQNRHVQMIASRWALFARSRRMCWIILMSHSWQDRDLHKDFDLIRRQLCVDIATHPRDVVHGASS